MDRDNPTTDNVIRDVPWMGLGSVRMLARSWGLFVFRGVLALLFGVLALVQPLAALAALVILFGAWAFVDGINALVLAFSGWKSWQMVLAGIIGIAAGLITFFRPGITALGLYLTIAIWSIARGIIEIVLAIKLRKQVEGEIWLALAGIASIVFGVLMIIMPAAGVLALGWLVGVYALAFGVLNLFLAARLHRLRTTVREERVPPPIPPTPVMP